MNSEISVVILIFVVTVLLAIPLGYYIAGVYGEKAHWSDNVFARFERVIYSLAGIREQKPMTWKEHLLAMLTINLVWFLFSMFVLTNMASLPLNPDENPSMSADLAFNTTVSFVSNTNLQHYSGESGVSYLGQLVLMLFQFISAATGMAVCAAVFVAMKERTTTSLGNFYRFFVRSATRVLLPLSLAVAMLLLIGGIPMTFGGKSSFTSLEGDTVQVSTGPVAAMVAIKQLGTNGGGFFGANSAHPFENPSLFTNAVENVCILLIPIAMVFALGRVLGRPRFAWMVFGVMSIGFLLLLLPAIRSEQVGNPAIARLGIAQPAGSMEGKELRFGPVASAYWAVTTTCTSNGSVNAMHDSLMPIGGLMALLGMMVNSFYGGVGVGFLNFYVFVIIAVFISGLMVGRTPELLGKKIEAREMKIAAIVALLHPLFILAGAAISSYLVVTHPTATASWLNNPGSHGFSEMLYEYTSSAANNGSGFEGLGDNTPFWNISCGIIMLLARFLPIIGPVAIAGILASKKYIPESAGTLKTDTATFAVMVLAVIAIIAALSFFPALSLGPIAEYFGLKTT